MNSSATPKTIDEYIGNSPETVRKRLIELRDAIREAAPEADEKISYSMPAFTLRGMLLYFAAHKNHIGLYPYHTAIELFREELSTYKTAKGSIQFPNSKPLPIDLINRIVKFRVKENLIRFELKSKKSWNSGKRKTLINTEAIIYAPLNKVWSCWTSPEDITKWNFAAETWHSPHADVDLRPGGRFMYRMEAKDGSFGFDFGGRFDIIRTRKYIEYTIGDGRKVKIHFIDAGNKTTIIQTFEAEETNSADRQRSGWQAILDNFKKYTELK
jgi:uncharacterized protein YdhG (YjbR/CyaY superfamily)/uncharacterized protein YndB with AHSA1/START domain